MTYLILFLAFVFLVLGVMFAYNTPPLRGNFAKYRVLSKLSVALAALMICVCLLCIAGQRIY